MIEKIQRGDALAFRQFFESFHPSLCYFANKYLNDKEVSMDIVQDAFAYFWNRRSEIHSISSAKCYLFKYVKNRSINYLRDRRVETAYLKRIETKKFASNTIIEEETHHIIYNAIQLLSPQGQRVIEMTLDGLKNHEIAIQLGISLNTVKTIKGRAFKALRVELKDRYIELFFHVLFRQTDG